MLHLPILVVAAVHPLRLHPRSWLQRLVHTDMQLGGHPKFLLLLLLFVAAAACLCCFLYLLLRAAAAMLLLCCVGVSQVCICQG